MLSAALDHLAEKLTDPIPRDLQRLASERRRPVHAPYCPADAPLLGCEIAFALQGAQHRVERSRTELVAVPAELFDHPLPVQLALDGVVQDVKPNQSGKQLSMFHAPRSSFLLAYTIEIRYREPIIELEVISSIHLNARMRRGRSNLRRFTMQSNEHDPRTHTQNMQRRLQETIDHLRQDIEKVDEPQLKAMFETSAEVLGGLVKAFQDYERKNESAWQE